MKKLYFLIFVLCFFNVLSAQNINIPDIYFKNQLRAYGGFSKDKDGITINNIDLNHDGEIQENEALNVYYLEVPLNDSYRDHIIRDLTGIKYFKNLRELNCGGNYIETLDVSMLKDLRVLKATCSVVSLNISNLTNLEVLKVSGRISAIGGVGTVSLDLEKAVNLKELSISNTDISTLDFRHLKKLEILSLNSNSKLEYLNLAQLTLLRNVSCGNNQLTYLNVSGDSSLENLAFSNTKITSLNLKGLANLKTLICPLNQIETLDVSGMKYLTKLNCRDNLLTTLDLTNTTLSELDFSGNKLKNLTLPNVPSSSFYGFNNLLETLNLKNGVRDLMEGIYFNLGNESTLKYICTDDVDWYSMQELRLRRGYKFEYNTYCTFSPGGIVYEIKGNQKFDIDNNGCDASDIIFPNLKFDITNGKLSGGIISNYKGDYSIMVGEGTHKITPILENPNYFKVSPINSSVVFPSKNSPFIQDFCITANGIHSDLEIALLPLDAARPGFDANYKIVYKNKGNVLESGSVSLKFNDAVLDYVSSSPTFSSQTVNNLVWNFTNLKPFESREIVFSLNLNGPTETPAVNNGDILKLTSRITSQNTDEIPQDNLFILNQAVVGSYDPNDKTCLEGNIITPSLIGEYVHYMIRFENTGNYPAQNIVVKDMIDLSKFDISTLIPTSSSHSFSTKITEGNKVEFIFENINLPFDDANNDGYVAFKIKTKPTLVVGDTFTNEANIYFDYNFPILTNKATSTFQTTLATQDFEFLNYFTVFPNPANEDLNITNAKNIVVQSITVYDVLGQLVIAIPNAKSVSTIDVSNLKTGNYFIKVKSDKGSSSTKFIKK